MSPVECSVDNACFLSGFGARAVFTASSQLPILVHCPSPLQHQSTVEPGSPPPSPSAWMSQQMLFYQNDCQFISDTQFVPGTKHVDDNVLHHQSSRRPCERITAPHPLCLHLWNGGERVSSIRLMTRLPSSIYVACTLKPCATRLRRSAPDLATRLEKEKKATVFNFKCSAFLPYRSALFAHTRSTGSPSGRIGIRAM